MKKILAIILSLCLLCGATAFATEYNQDSITDPTTILTTTVAESYTLTIPATLDITYGTTLSTLGVTVSNYRLRSVNELHVTASYGGNLINQDRATDTIPYTMTWQSTDFNSGAVMEFDNNASYNCFVNITKADWNAAAAGDYEDTVTFTAAIAAK